jgi:hypothetical protein
LARIVEPSSTGALIRWSHFNEYCTPSVGVRGQNEWKNIYCKETGNMSLAAKSKPDIAREKLTHNGFLTQSVVLMFAQTGSIIEINLPQDQKVIRKPIHV